MQSILYLPASDGTANASLMTVQTLRSPGASAIIVNTVTGVHTTGFHATMGAPHTFTDPITSEVITVISDATAVDFAGHINAGQIIIDSIAPGYVDTRGSLVGDIVVIRPTTDWSNNVANVLGQSLNDDGSIKAAAYTYDPIVSDSVKSGGIWSALTGFNAAMTTLAVWQGGYTGTIAAVATRAFTASKDTYVDALRTLSGYTNTFTLVYTEVANAAAAPALAANSVRLAKVVTSGAAVTSITQYGRDSLNNVIYPVTPVAIPPMQKLVINNRDLGSAAGSGVFDIGSQPFVWIDPADYAIPGRTTYMRLVAQINKTAGDTVAAVLAKQSDNSQVIGIQTQLGTTNGMTDGVVLSNNGSTVMVLRTNEVAFPATAFLAKLRMWNQTSGTNPINVPMAYLEIYWR